MAHALHLALCACPCHFGHCCCPQSASAAWTIGGMDFISASTLPALYNDLSPAAQTAAGLLALGLLAKATGWAAQWVLLHFVPLTRRAMQSAWINIVLHDHVLVRVAKIVPSVVIQIGIGLVDRLPASTVNLIHSLAVAFTTYHMVRAVTVVFDEMNAAHDRHDGPRFTQTNSIKSYVQLGKLAAWIMGGLLIAAAAMDKSPLLLLSGLGAMSAVLMLVFKDTLLSFVAGVQIASNDMMRVGDWIEMPQAGADGFVIDIALNTVKVQNWDKTITTIPTWRLMSDSFKNWRSMFESGGRRIMRNLHIDATTVHLLTPAERERLGHITLLHGYWDARDGLLAQSDAAERAMPMQAIAAHMVTNLAAFKAYVQAYLTAHPRIHRGPGMFMLVRTLEPTPQGIPLQLYCFTATTAWAEYEGIQGEIFDHLIGVLPQFGLALYQRSSDKPLPAGSLHQSD